MPKRREETPAGSTHRRRRPALSPEARENQLISLAVDLVEKRLIEGTASAQETVHFLRLGSMKARTELDLLKEQSELLKAKTEAIRSAKRVEELYENALNAMKIYSGVGGADDQDL